MFSIYRKEINSFFSSLIGYIAIIVFLLVTGLFVWVFPDTNVLDYGFASLDSLFFYAPWVFMFLIPAITMRSFAEEFSTGTIEFLSTKPIKDYSIIFGKYLAAFTLVIFSVLPTIIYYISVYKLGAEPGNIDGGGFWGSFIGLILLGAVFVSIGIFASSITSNQIVSFIMAVFLCFIVFAAFDMISRMGVFYATLDSFIELLGIQAHYESISRGVLDTRDLVYFASVIGFFLISTKTAIESRKW